MVRVTTHVDGDTITSRIKGSVKDDFFNDCIKRNFTEAKMARVIFETYYSIIKLQPFLVEKEMTEIKKYLVEKIKL